MIFNKQDAYAFASIAAAVLVLSAASSPPVPPAPEFKVRVKQSNGAVEVSFRNTTSTKGWTVQRSTNLISWEDVAWSNGSRWLSVTVTDSGADRHAFYRAVAK